MRQNVAFDIHIPTRVLSSCSQRAGPGTIGTLHVADVGEEMEQVGPPNRQGPGKGPRFPSSRCGSSPWEAQQALLQVAAGPAGPLTRAGHRPLLRVRRYLGPDASC